MERSIIAHPVEVSNYLSGRFDLDGFEDLHISIGSLTPAANRPEKKKGKRKKADVVSKTANQKGKGPENAMDYN